MFAEFDISIRTNYKARTCSLTSLLSFIILVISILLIALLSLDRLEFFSEVNKTLSSIELTYYSKYSLKINTGDIIIEYPNQDNDIYAITKWEDQDNDNLLSISFAIYGLNSIKQLNLSYVLLFKERELLNIHYEDILTNDISNLLEGTLTTLYCHISFTQNYIMKSSSIPRSLLIDTIGNKPLDNRSGLPFKQNLRCNTIVEKITDRYIGVKIKLFKNNTEEIKYEVDAFKLIRQKWKKVLAASIIFFYLARKTLKYLADSRVLEITKSFDNDTGNKYK